MNDESIAQRTALRVENVTIHDMPGIDKAFAVGSFGPGITVIYGPNASGKSRAASALQAIIWPEQADASSHVQGQLSLAETSWTVAARYGRAIREQDGQPIGTSPVSHAPASQLERYLLTLHDLLQSENRGFAELIQRESAGGFDFPAARQTLEVTNPPRMNARLVRKELDEARALVRGIRQEERQLEGRERARQTLEERRNGAARAEVRIGLLRHALRHADARTSHKEKSIVLEQFSPIVEHLQGNEYDRVCEFQAQIDKASQELEFTQREVDRLQQEVVRTGFDGGIPQGGELTQLEKYLLSMRQGITDLQQLALELAEREAVVVTIPRLAGQGVTSAQFARLSAEGLRELSELSRRMRDVQGNEQAQKALERWLQTSIATGDLDSLGAAIEQLNRWLQTPAPDDSESPLQRGALFLAAIAIAALSIALAFTVSPIWLVALGIVPFVVWVAWRKPEQPSVQQRDQMEADYSRLGAPLPETWRVDAVVTTLTALQKQQAGALLEQEKRSRWAGLDEERRDLAGRRSALEATRKRQMETLGIELQEADADELRLVADAIDRWLQAEEMRVALVARRDAIWAEYDASLEGLNTLLLRLGANVCSTVAEAEAQLALVTERVQIARTAITSLERLRTEMQHVSHDIEQNQARAATMFGTAGLENGDMGGLRWLCDQTQPYREARAALEQSEAVVRTFAIELDAEPALLTRERSDLELEIVQLEPNADERDRIVEDLARLDQDLEQARQQTALEEAVHRESIALLNLASRREQDVAKAVRWEIAESVAQATRDQNRPRVFHKARELFTQFTSGAWRLELDDGGSAAFYATETSTRRLYQLVELSSGTRVQLLMAVRLAFLEVSEEGPQLPLILDETLGNSDDVRADAIIDATIEIARRGRQIIYFTAQRDEVFKWRSRLSEGGVGTEFSEIDLAQVRELASATRTELPMWDPTAFQPPAVPQGLAHGDAREVLRVPPLNLWADHDDDVDLWYCLHEVEGLNSMRRAGVRTWGQYQSLRTVEMDRTSLLDEAIHRQANRRMAILQQTRRLWQQGRARPMTHGDLVSSRAISDRFIDAVTDLAERKEWNAEEVLLALRNREISAFRAGSIETLDTYCREKGLIPDRVPLDLGEIRTQVWVTLRDDDPENLNALLAEVDGMFLLMFPSDSGTEVPDAWVLSDLEDDLSAITTRT